MTEELVIYHCSPTMAGMKTGSLFTCPKEEVKELTENIRKLNCRLVPNGIRLLPVKRMEHRILLYMYRPGKLEEDFRNHEAEEILGAKGYPVGNADQCVVELVRRLNGSETFPHEIGLFHFHSAAQRCGGVYGKQYSRREICGNMESLQRCGNSKDEIYTVQGMYKGIL